MDLSTVAKVVNREEDFPSRSHCMRAVLRFPAICQCRSWNKWYLSIERSVRTHVRQCSNTLLCRESRHDKWLENCMIIHAVAQKRKILDTLYIVVALKRENTYSGWLSSVKTVALKRENTHRHQCIQDFRAIRRKNFEKK